MSERFARRRALSQNFLRERVCAQLAEDAALGRGDLVFEIGAGAGALTRELVKRAGHVIAVEADPVLASRLRASLASTSNLKVHCADALTVALPTGPFRVVSNIPFHLTTDIFHRLFDRPNAGPARADLVVQLEVAVKRSSVLRANLLNLSWAPWYEMLLTRRLPRQLFNPMPATDSAVLSIRRRVIPLVPGPQRRDYLALVNAAYRDQGLTSRQVLRRWFGRRELLIMSQELGLQLDAPLNSIDVWQWAALNERRAARQS